jgi:hypothetical protein
MTQTINLFASARPNLGAAGQCRCTPTAEGGAPTSVGEDNREAPLPAGRGNDLDARAKAMTLRTAGRQGARRSPGGRGGRRRGGGWGGGQREEYGDQEPRRPGQVGEEAARVPGADGGGPAA